MAPIPVVDQFTDEQKQQIVEEYAKGKTQAELAIQFSCPRRTMMKLCVKLGLHKSHSEAQKSRFVDGVIEQVARLRAESKTLHQIATITGHSVSAVHRACRTSGAKVPDTPIQAADIKTLMADYQNGKTLAEIAEQYGTSAWAVRKLLLDAGLSLREPLLRRDVVERTPVIVELPNFVDNAEWFKLAYVERRYSLTQIAKFVGRSIGYVSKKLSVYGVELRSISESLAILDRQAVLAAYKELGSMQKVARRFNCTSQAIKNILEDNDITPRTPSEILSGPGNAFFGKQHSPEVRDACAATGAYYGAKFWIDHPEYVEVVKAKATEYWSDAQRRYEDARRISRLRSEGKCGARRGRMASRFGEMAYDSSYEMQFIEFCETDKRVAWLERDFAVIDYDYRGKRVFVPDFRMWLSNGDCFVIEIKSDWYQLQEKEREKIIAGFGKFSTKFMVLSHADDFSQVARRIELSLTPAAFEFSEVTTREIEVIEYMPFYGCFHYLGKSGRRGYTLGAFLAGQLIGAATISSITRAEIAKRHELTQSEMRELVRFCIHPDFHKENFASWFLSRAVASYRASAPDVKLLIAFADATQGHIGTIYKAANWKSDGVSGPSYHYVGADGIILHKKTVYDQAAKVGMNERSYADGRSLRRVLELGKARYLYNL